MKTPAELKAEILRLTREYAALAHGANRPAAENTTVFEPGKTTVPYAGRVFDENEVEAAVSSTLDFWLTLGPEGDAFERELASFMGVKRSLLVNSGSSANLVALSSLTSHKLGDRRLSPGDEVITVAAGFPTTVAPILQNGLVPVFIDNDPVTLNGRVDQLEGAFVAGKTKAVMMAHTLGNPFNLSAVTEFCERHGLWLIEDNCDALGCLYDGKLTGTFGDLSTQSFYPPHHLTLGEGGAVNIVRDLKLKILAESFRDWGRDCWCASGQDNTCKKRFGWQLGELPEGYDHKYIYSHLGYNLKPLDTQAAIGREQLKKLPGFVRARIDNWAYLRAALAGLEEFFEFMLPTHATGWSRGEFQWDASGHRTECSWFGFMMLVRPDAPFSRRDLALALDAAKIGNRMLFGGNLVRQPAFVQLRRDRPGAFRVAGDLPGADRIMNESIFVGVYPGLTRPMLDYIAETVRAFVRKSKSAEIMFAILPTSLPGVRVLRPRIFSDARGDFVKTFHADLFRREGIDFQPAEEFFSVSRKNVLRGMHFQLPPNAHNKLVYCVAGRVLDVVADLRRGSPTHGRSMSRELSAANREMLFIPAGLAHGFLSLEDDTVMVYQTDTVHAPESDAGIHWQSLGFDWPAADPVVSDRDRAFPPLAEFDSPF